MFLLRLDLHWSRFGDVLRSILAISFLKPLMAIVTCNVQVQYAYFNGDFGHSWCSIKYLHILSIHDTFARGTYVLGVTHLHIYFVQFLG